MATYEATRYDFDGGNIQGLVGVDTGSILPWPTASAPSGYLNCDGSAVSRSTYADLFGVIGTTYGVGDGSTTFNLPDLETNIPLGKSGTKALASTGGANTTNITGINAANTTIDTNTMAAHSHNTAVDTSDSNTGDGPNCPKTSTADTANSSGGGGAHGHGINAASVSLQQPTIDINYIIKT